jgi:hypothetical protein
MKKLLSSLRDSDSAVLPVIAQVWGVDIARLDADEIIPALAEALLDTERAAQVWEGLDDAQRGALQTLLGERAGKMTLLMYERLYGEIRKMGKGAIEREKPHQNPASPAEALFYRGLIYEGFEQVPTGARPVVYVPPDLIEALPTHKTGYDDLDQLPGDEGQPVTDLARIEEIDAELLDHITPTDTSVVDDLTTLLAYLQIEGGGTVEEGALSAADREALLPHLINPDAERLAFLFLVALSAELVEFQEDQVYPRRAEVRRWLEGRRSIQLKHLANAWRDSTSYRDLWHVPGLHPEPTGWPYDPVVARGAILSFLRDFAPPGGWWSLEDFVYAVREVDPDFQRPSGDYDSWYIRNDAGEYLRGFESWDSVEGALLEFCVQGPLHWLGMVDLAEDAARLTAYGRAFVNEDAWPAPQETDEKLIVNEDGTLLASRRVPRIDRFQVMRFTTWISPPATSSDPYTYELTTLGIQRAAAQGINSGHITAFLSRMLDGAPLPPAIVQLLEQTGDAPVTGVTIERLLVLRTTAPETLDFIAETPSLRRYLGARLGPMAVVVRADQHDALRAALAEHGIDVEIVG